MSYTKAYTRINWQNQVDGESTPLGATNMNKIDYSLNEVDNRIISIDITKSNQSDLLSCVSDITYDATSGIFTFTWKNGTTKTVDLNVEKIPVSFSLSEDGILTMTTADGTTFTADIGSMIPVLSFVDSNTISVTMNTTADGTTYSFTIIDGSVTGDKLQPNYLADVTAQAAIAESSASTAVTAASNASDAEGIATAKAAEAAEYAAQASDVVPIATATLAGKVKGGGNVTIAADGQMNVDLSNLATDSELQAVSTTATQAQSTADTAKTNAETAQSTANTAKTNAATAQSTANSAQTVANAAIPKSAMSGANVNDASKVPTSALLYSINDNLNKKPTLLYHGVINSTPVTVANLLSYTWIYIVYEAGSGNAMIMPNVLSSIISSEGYSSFVFSANNTYRIHMCITNNETVYIPNDMDGYGIGKTFYIYGVN